MPYKDPEKAKEVKRRYYERMKNDIGFKQRKREAYSRWYQTHKAEAYAKHREWDKLNRERRNLSVRHRNAQLKFEVLLHYSVSAAIAIPICVRCNFSDIRALTLDLIKGGHNRSGLPVGDALYRYLRKQGYPEGWQVLCMNCQWIKRWTNNELH